MQATFVEEETQGVTFEMVRLERLPSNELLVSPPPDKKLIDSMRTYGLQAPIRLRRKETLEVVSGRRRIKAARALGWVHIDAVVSSLEDDATLLLKLSDHATRRENPMFDYYTILDLYGRGYDAKKIALKTGMRIQTVLKRMQLGSILGQLQELLSIGELTPSLAGPLSKLSVEDQSDLLHRYIGGETITLGILNSYRKAEVAAVNLELDFGDVPNPDDDDPRVLRRALEIMAADFRASEDKPEFEVDDYIANAKRELS